MAEQHDVRRDEADIEHAEDGKAEPVHRAEAEEHIRRSGGAIVRLPDEEILAAQREVGALEGIYCEAASAAGIAGVRRERPSGAVVCVITGHGLKEAAA